VYSPAKVNIIALHHTVIDDLPQVRKEDGFYENGQWSWRQDVFNPFVQANNAVYPFLINKNSIVLQIAKDVEAAGNKSLPFADDARVVRG
jgi:hypothetical protein